MLNRLKLGEGEIAHGNLWVFSLAGESIEIRMDVDDVDSDSDPIDTVPAMSLERLLGDLREEVVSRLASGHILDDRHWSQQNPA